MCYLWWVLDIHHHGCSTTRNPCHTLLHVGCLWLYGLLSVSYSAGKRAYTTQRYICSNIQACVYVNLCIVIEKTAMNVRFSNSMFRVKYTHNGMMKWESWNIQISRQDYMSRSALKQVNWFLITQNPVTLKPYLFRLHVEMIVLWRWHYLPM